MRARDGGWNGTTWYNSTNEEGEQGEEGEEGEEVEWVRSEFGASPKMSTYLVAFTLFNNMTKLQSNYTSIDGRVVNLTYHVEHWMAENATLVLEIRHTHQLITSKL